ALEQFFALLGCKLIQDSFETFCLDIDTVLHDFAAFVADVDKNYAAIGGVKLARDKTGFHHLVDDGGSARHGDRYLPRDFRHFQWAMGFDEKQDFALGPSDIVLSFAAAERGQEYLLHHVGECVVKRS